MYTCSNCGTAFDGRVCPNCCAMRPAAAVLGNSGRILRSREAAAVSPQDQAERFAEELEYSRKADEWRRRRQEHADSMRRRAAQLAQAAEAAAAPPEEPAPQPTEEELRYARQVQKAANWQRKAPRVRSAQPDEVDVQLPEALRALKIDGSAKDRSPAAKQPPKPHPKPEESSSQPELNAPATTSANAFARRLSYPGGAQIPQPRARSGSRAPVRSERLDAAWRSFASGEAASGSEVAPRLPDSDRSGASDVPRPPTGEK
ncbi:MAG: hypothetical protein E7554_07435 [Ruminococcaceae bacterium]|nr:hypothetical protein [Oscillospiraceae bacterium]